MVIAYRIAQRQYIDDLSGYGAYLYGGRWNLPGVHALYLASHRSLAYMEYLVHQFNREIWPQDLMIASIAIRNESLIRELEGHDLPSAWQSMKYEVEVQRTAGSQFSNKILGFKAPSVVVPGEHNFVLNPQFSNFESEVYITEIDEANFDERLKPKE